MFTCYGGEDVLIILRGIPLDDAGVLSERIRVAVEEAKFTSAGTRLPVSVSVGVAAYSEAMQDPMELVEHADEALYAAKQGGRNRVLRRYADGSMK